MQKIERSRNKKTGLKQKLHSLYGEMRKNRSAYFMMTPFFILFLVFTVLPIIGALPTAFADFRIPGSPVLTGIENFRNLFIENEQFFSALKNTLLSLLITGLGGSLLCIFAAWLISPLGSRLKTVFAVIFCLPSFMYGAFAVCGIVFGEGMESPLNSVLMSLGIITSPVDWLDRSPASFLLMQLPRLWGTFGISFLVTLAGFDEARGCYENTELYDAARVDGLSNRFWHLIFVTIPLSAPHLALAAILQTAAALSPGSVFTVTPSNMTLTDYMLTLGAGEFDIGMASAIGVLITAFSVIVYFILRKIFRALNG